MRSIEEIEAILTVMGVVMFYVQSDTGLWWAQVDSNVRYGIGRAHYGNTYPMFTIKNGEMNGFMGIYKTKQEACNKALDRFIRETE